MNTNNTQLSKPFFFNNINLSSIVDLVILLHLTFIHLIVYRTKTIARKGKSYEITRLKSRIPVLLMHRDLKVNGRQNLILFLQENFPESLPKTKVEFLGDKTSPNPNKNEKIKNIIHGMNFTST